MRAATTAVPFKQVYASSSDETSPIHIKRTSAFTFTPWISANGSKYPQEVGLALAKRSFVKSMRLTTHAMYTPTKVQVWAGRLLDGASPRASEDIQLYFTTEWQYLCSIEWSTPYVSQGGATADALIDINEPLERLKLELDAPRTGQNQHNQVALVHVELMGIPLAQPSPRHVKSKVFHSQSEVHQALLDSGVPLDVISDALERDKDVDSYTAKSIQHILAVQASCVEKEAYDFAKQLTQHITALTDVGQKIHTLQMSTTQAIAQEDYDAALACRQNIEALEVLRERAVAAAFAVCQASQISHIEVAPRPESLWKKAPKTIFDAAMQRWLDDERISLNAQLVGSICHSSPLIKAHTTFMDTMWGSTFMACAASPSWKTRRACIETAEQYAAILVPVFDVETRYEMYYMLIQSFVADPTVPVLVALLHLVRTIYEQQSQRTNDRDSFGTAALRRGVLRPGVRRIIHAVFGYCCRYNAILREDCVRTIRFLAQQSHVAELLIEATWLETKQATTEFETLVGLKFLQDEFIAWPSLHVTMSKETMTEVLVDMGTFTKVKARDANRDVSDAAVECAALLAIVRQGKESSAWCLPSVEAHMPLFRRFPFSATEHQELVECAEMYAKLHNLPMQFETYILDPPALDGFNQFNQLEKGAVAFQGHVEPRQIEPNPSMGSLMPKPPSESTTAAKPSTPRQEAIPSPAKVAIAPTWLESKASATNAVAETMQPIQANHVATEVAVVAKESKLTLVDDDEKRVETPEDDLIRPIVSMVEKPSTPSKKQQLGRISTPKKNQITPTNSSNEDPPTQTPVGAIPSKASVAAVEPKPLVTATSAHDRIETLQVVGKVAKQVHQNNDDKKCTIS
ncbi:hypothetical protein AC1031_009177 [Aphanomyces cochlioides]|nr:hypothetical protein AC1031_009177 [Aphanomyces cochlioides]